MIGRYSKTSAYLGRWADELEGFQGATVKVLINVEETERGWAATRTPTPITT